MQFVLTAPSAPSPDAYSLSVRDTSSAHGDIVKHYRIRSLDGGGYYISPRVTFSSLPELIHHYSRKLFGFVSWKRGRMGLGDTTAAPAAFMGQV